MGAYILRRILLIIPTLFGIMLLNFVIIQFLPGGPVQQALATLQDVGGTTAERFSGGGETVGGGGEEGLYRGAQGLEEKFKRQLERDYGLDRPAYERFGIMIWNYIRFDFGESFFRSISVIDLILEKMPVSISLGLWTTLLAYLISIPLGIAKAVREGTRFDTMTSAVIIAAYAIPTFVFAVLLRTLFAGGSFVQWFPLRGLTSVGFEEMSWLAQIGDYFWHLALPLLAMGISGFAVLTLLTKNSFLDQINSQYVMTARSKGLSEGRVLYGHVFRNAMLIVIAGFPGAFISVFFTGSIVIEVVFSLDGLGYLGFEAVKGRDYPIVLGTTFIFGLLGLVVKLISDLTYVWIDPRIDFERRGN